MKVRPLSRAEVRSIDARALEDLGLPGLILMENAGRGAAAWLRGRLESGPPAPGRPPRVAILCGPGNNGGDGGVVARHLDAWGFAVRVLWFAQPGRLKGDAAAQAAILGRSGIESAVVPEAAEPDAIAPRFEDADWLVDALLGTGLDRPVEGLMARAIAALNRSGKPILALDLPSGLDADTGLPLGDAVRAEATATFVAPKLGFAAPGASAYTGAVAVVDIGVPRFILAPFLVAD